MKIKQIKTWHQHFKLTKPFEIAYEKHDAVDNIIVEVYLENGLIGYGAAAPAFEITGETQQACQQALDHSATDWLIGCDLGTWPALCQRLKATLKTTPAAQAALEQALFDAYAKTIGLPLVDILGRVHEALPTSVTLGIRTIDETLQEAQDLVAQGFQVLKVKTGKALEVDLEKIYKLRETLGQDIILRVDPNQGYDLAQLQQWLKATQNLNLEFLEQPLSVERRTDLFELSLEARNKIALDENVHSPQDALACLVPEQSCGIFNIKLMKCGGIAPALQIAQIAESADVDLMWGCMDESIISISAALHVALACPKTKYLDLDGSLDLVQDVAKGGFKIQDGKMYTLPAPGLGVVML